MKACQIISTCARQGGGDRKLKLTKQIAEAFTVSTRNNVDVAKLLLADKDFDYVLPAIFADEALEKFFGQARQRRGGNFYIDVVDIMAAAKIVNLQTLIKHDIMPESSSRVLDCDRIVQLRKPAERSEFIDEITTQDTQELLRSDDTLKHEVVYLAGYLVYKYGDSTSMEEIQGCQSNPIQSTIQSNRSIFGQSAIQISTIDYSDDNPIEIDNPKYHRFFSIVSPIFFDCFFDFIRLFLRYFSIVSSIFFDCFFDFFRLFSL